MSQPPVLPPIHDQLPQYPPAQMNGAQIHHQPPPPPPHQGPYTHTYSDNSHQPPPAPYQANGPYNGPPQMRYALPPQNMDPREIQAARQKKEIKRRTKTGCLTCRKRRIKCDEGHPTCRNCQKSKRDCMGYDPIFKAQGTPAPIQPALGMAHGARTGPASSSSPVGAPTSGHSAPPPMYADAAGSNIHATPPQQQGAYGAPLDPTLDGSHVPAAAVAPKAYTTNLLPRRKYTPIPIEDLFMQGNVSEAVFPTLDESQLISEQDLIEIQALYRGQYMRGLDSFFETTWYSMIGDRNIRANLRHAPYLRYCVDRFRNPPQTPEEFAALPSIEARLVWILASLPRDISPASHQHDNQNQTLLSRISTIEHLLTGAVVPPGQPLSTDARSLPSPSDHSPEARNTQSAFWQQLSQFTSTDDTTLANESAHTLESILTALGSMRNVLSGLENRDVLYSMAIARHYGGRAETFEPEAEDKILVSNSEDPEDEIAKLVVAMSFLASEEQAGTTQVVQRLVGMCRRSWVKGRRKPLERTRDPEQSIKDEKSSSIEMLLTNGSEQVKPETAHAAAQGEHASLLSQDIIYEPVKEDESMADASAEQTVPPEPHKASVQEPSHQAVGHTTAALMEGHDVSS